MGGTQVSPERGEGEGETQGIPGGGGAQWSLEGGEVGGGRVGSRGQRKQQNIDSYNTPMDHPHHHTQPHIHSPHTHTHTHTT